MYFPYLRCKQFELLALKEIAPHIGKPMVSPILEPVKKSTGAFERTLDILVFKKINFTITLNPSHGDFSRDPSSISSMINKSLSNYQNFQLGVIMNQFTNLDEVTDLIGKVEFKRDITLIHHGRINDIDALRTWCDDHTIKYNLHGENFPVRRYRGIIVPDTKVLLEDKFKPQIKNADYQKVPDEFFTDDHLYFEDDGYKGFGDFLTIGDDYSESGWLPYAIAIHLTYIKDNGEIWIRHFVSDSNIDTTDVAGKFGEALEKLIEFIDDEHIHTKAAEEFRDLHNKGHYPGLGSIKKLSIMHHIELVYDILK